MDSKKEMIAHCQFRNRPLVNEGEVFQYNAWDNIVWDEEQENEAKTKLAIHASNKIDDQRRDELIKDAHKNWDRFYSMHNNRFFKDRHWLFLEYPELSPFKHSTDDGTGVRKATDSLLSKVETYVKTVLEVGCGVGNTVFPLLEAHQNNPGFFLYCCDFSETAIDLLKENKLYDEKKCQAFVCDISAENWDVPFEENSLDFIVLIFVFSALKPDRMRIAVKNMHRYLKPGGMVLFRDYGRYDLAQLRFKKGSCLEDNFYARGDGTLVYFFTEDELRRLFLDHNFEEVSIIADRQLQVNRIKKLKMYRCWMVAKFKKPINQS